MVSNIHIRIAYTVYGLIFTLMDTFCSGVPLIAVFQASNTAVTLSVERINLVDLSGTIYETIVDIMPLEGNAFAINLFHLMCLFSGR